MALPCINDQQCLFLIHAHGFPVHDDPEKKFLIKELSWYNFGDRTAYLFRFRLHRTIRSLIDQDYNSAEWCLRFKHSLIFKDYRGDLNQRSARNMLKRISDYCNSRRYAFLFKGQNEKMLLHKAGAQYIIDLSSIGCPSYNHLQADPFVAERALALSSKITDSALPRCNRHSISLFNFFPLLILFFFSLFFSFFSTLFLVYLIICYT